MNAMAEGKKKKIPKTLSMIRRNRKSKDNEIINWLDKNHVAANETLVYQQKVLNKVCILIITKLYQGTEAC